MFGFGRRRKIEQGMAEWLAHPSEFGVQPKLARLVRTYEVNVMTHGDEAVHLVAYEMPDGIRGRGFVNGSLTWSFFGEGVNAIEDDDLLIAYYGWAWLFCGLQADTVSTEFHSLTEQTDFLEKKKREGFQAIHLHNRYKIGTSELFEFTATKEGARYKGAGDTEDEVCYSLDDPRASLPSIYFLLGRVVIKKRYT